MATILLGITGSIAAYKACELTRLFVKDGHRVHVIMTQAATRFVAPLTFRTLSRNPVAVDLFDEPDEWIPGHISFAERGDVLVIAPCSANVLAKLAHGLADDLLTATALATQAPLVLAPA
ncbi:MAG: flavoprotein, partial [bacterium]